MKKILLILFVMVYATNAQGLSQMTFGSESTLDIITWNIEWFPKNGQTTVDSVRAILDALDADIYALQEIDDTTKFKAMVNSLDGYDYYFWSSYFGGLAYVYDTTTIKINHRYEILTSQQYWRPFPRAPQVLDFTYDGSQYFILDNHFKAMGDGIMDTTDQSDEETRRRDASRLIDSWITQFHPDDKVIVVGDLNDILTDDVQNNVFQCFIDKPTEYEFIDMAIAHGESEGWSYPSWPSHLDHILITNEVYDDFGATDYTVEVIKPDHFMGSWNSYDGKVSDHRPVGFKLKIPVSAVAENVVPEKFEITNYPNPFNPETTIQFTLPQEYNNELVKLNIYNIQGELVSSLVNETLPAGIHKVKWNGNLDNGIHASSGIYFYVVQSGSLLKSGKMILLK